ncbi:NrfD/PsrC family molybdoenzyme membrane anchor subunit [Planctellipticum variicoloris]|uniref:NrfD/PsrC family molybdoenzyme membrane anchor subunit n=1 Tax=Planctellipticum variicoloris TaxID=3064265 RepID=UPI0030135870|nr:polysulfide reductase NrfD [Planctomycetaceae bacterium SH412]
MATVTASLVDNSIETPGQRAPLVLGGQDYASVTDTVCRIAEAPRMPLAWYVALAISSSLTAMLGVVVAYLLATGIGVWGNMNPVFWAFDIVNFVFWVGIAHAGTLISAVLFLFRQNWRTSINRASEAMTIFAVICAGMFPAIHVGRIWVIWYTAPLPTQNWVWQNFRSPLMWDVFAISTYASVSAIFWYMGMVPDFATFRDRATNKWKYFAYGILSLGWNGSARAWHRYERAYLLLAAMSTPLVLSVHTIVSFDFATSQLPGWHTTIFPPYFVAGAIFSGFGMVLTLMVPSRELFGLKDLITPRHLENMCKIILATGTIVGYSYAMEFFIAWYSGSRYEQFAFINRAFGPYWWAYWTMVSCNVLSPQLFWFKKFRTTPWLMFIVSIFVNIGMWFERFVIVVTSLHRDFLPSSWAYYMPTTIDICTLIGSFGLFFTLFLLFLRFLPVVAMAEIRGVMPHPQGEGEQH